MAENKNYFEILNQVDCRDKVEKKNGLTYLSWAFAWGELKKRFPDSTYTVYENKDGWNYFHDGGTCWVKTGVTVNGIEHIEYLPVMDYKNKSIPLGSVTSFDVNKTIQRSLTKAIARHGLGLDIYSGDFDDLPSESDGKNQVKRPESKKAPSAPVQKSEDATDYRTILRQFLKDMKIDPKTIVQACGLTPESTNEEWKKACEYAKGIVSGGK